MYCYLFYDSTVCSCWCFSVPPATIGLNVSTCPENDRRCTKTRSRLTGRRCQRQQQHLLYRGMKHATSSAVVTDSQSLAASPHPRGHQRRTTTTEATTAAADNNNNSISIPAAPPASRDQPASGPEPSSSHLMPIRDSPGRARCPSPAPTRSGRVRRLQLVHGRRQHVGLLPQHVLTAIPSVLGATPRGVAGARQGGQPAGQPVRRIGRSFHRKSPKVPKVPRPARALMVFDSVKRGIG
ncbi:hypothetical protein RRG08_063506 [Elysia crispata]|uniref:Uncharacterized protein n=1 Tax=Elysia crispata TaxID=231223 RepID=A0AAE0Y3P3_9GAST|nr:hypothetical protein RRG08_063506 [Elysia crispata]